MCTESSCKRAERHFQHQETRQPPSHASRNRWHEYHLRCAEGPHHSPSWPTPDYSLRGPRRRDVGKLGQKELVVLERIRRRFRLDRSRVPQGLGIHDIHVILCSLVTRRHVQKEGEKSSRYLVLRPSPKGPCAGGIHIDGADIWNENFDRPA